MSASYSSFKQRHTPQHPCPICDGDEHDRRGKGIRCAGMTTTSNIYCQREQFAGGLPLDESTSPPTYRHWRYGACPCGVEHNPSQKTHQDQRQTHSDAYLKDLGEPSAIYDYCNESGTLLFQVLRYPLANGDKTFRQRRPNGKGGWIWKLDDEDAGITTPRVLYRLLELLKSGKDQVWLVEGEKAVEALRVRDLVATCSPHGALHWQDRYSHWLKGRAVVILPDNDDKGRKHAQEVAKSLHGIAASVRVVTLPDLPEKGDVFDYFKAGGTVGQLRQLAQEAADQETKESARDAYRDRYNELPFLSAHDLQHMDFPEPKSPVPGLITEGTTILAAGPKNGKSCLSIQLADAIARGGKALGQIDTEGGKVLYIYLEENEAGTQAHLEMLAEERGEWSPNLIFCHEWPRLGMGGVECLELWLDQHPDTVAIFIDMFISIWPAEGKERSAVVAEYNIGKKLTDLSNQRHVAIVGLMHTGKLQHEDPIHDVILSNGFAGSVHNILTIRQQPGTKQYVLMTSGRRIKRQALAMSFDDTHRRWNLDGKADEVAKTQERAAILDLLCEYAKEGETLTVKELAVLLHKKVEAISYLLLQMKKAGNIKEAGKKGQANLYTCTHAHTPRTPHSPSSSDSEQEEAEAEAPRGKNDGPCTPSSSEETPYTYEEENTADTATGDETAAARGTRGSENTPSTSGASAEETPDEAPRGTRTTRGDESPLTDDEFDALTDTGKQRIINLQEEMKKRQRALSEDDLDASKLNLIDDETRVLLEGWLPYKILEDPIAWLRGYVARIGYQVITWAGVTWGGTRSAWEREFNGRLDRVTAKLMTAHYQALEGGW